jgi:hypothetical protein
MLKIVKPFWVAKAQFDSICGNAYIRLQWAGKIINGQNPLWQDLELAGDCGAFRNEQEFHEFKSRILTQVGARAGYITNFLQPYHAAKTAYQFSGWGWDWKHFAVKANVKYIANLNQDNELIIDLGSVPGR